MENTFILPLENTIEENAKLWAEHYNNLIEYRQGLFLDFKATPELEKPAIDCLINDYDWTLEKLFLSASLKSKSPALLQGFF